VARALPATAKASSANQRGTLIGIAGVAVGIAACVALFLKSGESHDPTSATLAAEKAAQQPAAPHAVPGAAAAAAAAKSEEGVVSPEALAAAPQAAFAPDAAKVVPRSAPAAGPVPAAPSKAGAASSAVAQQNVVLDDDPEPAKPVTAAVTFAANGHVLRVSAAGPSGACIQAALSKAHIAPFARESFSATTTIRPP
jgi:hypothetical protein